jgi:hypothetical protein
MNYHEDCPHCGRRITAYALPLNRGLALAFLAFADARMRLARPVDKGELGLTNSQYANFQNLRHFGLIMQTDKGRAWDFTRLGLAFFQGQAKVITPAGHFGGRTLEPDALAWATHKARRGEVGIVDVLPEEWKRREEFKAEKRDAVA